MRAILTLALVAVAMPTFGAEVWIFTRTDCPISNRYAPAIAQLHREYTAKGVKFLLVYPEPGVSEAVMLQHQREYGLNAIPATADADLAKVRRAGVQVTPEAVVFDNGGHIVYRGRIDDRQSSLRIARTPLKHDLADALDATLAGRKPVAKTAKAIGCAIEGK